MRWQLQRFRFNDPTPGLDGLLPTRDVLYRGPTMFPDLGTDIRRYLSAMAATIRPSSNPQHVALLTALSEAIERPTWRTLMQGVYRALNAMLPDGDLLFASGDWCAGAMLRIQFWLGIVGFAEAADNLAYVCSTAEFREEVPQEARLQLLAVSRGWHAVAECGFRLPRPEHVLSPTHDGDVLIGNEMVDDLGAVLGTYHKAYIEFLASAPRSTSAYERARLRDAPPAQVPALEPLANMLLRLRPASGSWLQDLSDLVSAAADHLPEMPENGLPSAVFDISISEPSVQSLSLVAKASASSRLPSTHAADIWASLTFLLALSGGAIAASDTSAVLDELADAEDDADRRHQLRAHSRAWQQVAAERRRREHDVAESSAVLTDADFGAMVYRVAELVAWPSSSWSEGDTADVANPRRRIPHPNELRYRRLLQSIMRRVVVELVVEEAVQQSIATEMTVELPAADQAWLRDYIRREVRIINDASYGNLGVSREQLDAWLAARDQK